ncbi:MAG: ABC transporter permease [Bradymonadales bacterium]|nr:MAG: ABC transporter permease [Bradymonadales bacterium]
MKRYLITRAFLFLFTLWGITIVTFGMLQLAPGSPLEMKLLSDPTGGMGDRSMITEDQIERLRAQYHLDKPILHRYVLWLKDIAVLDFGTSFVDHRPVIEKIGERLPISLIFGGSAIFLALFLGIPLGLLSGRFHNRPLDRGIAFFSIALYAMPSYVLGILLLTFLGSDEFLNIFPIYGIQSDNYRELSLFGKAFDRLHHFVLPCVCYSIGGLAYITQQQRASILECLHQDYVRTARAKGQTERVVFYRHAFRNSLIPIVTILGALIPGIVGSSIIIESLFSIPGLGLLVFESLLARDYPTIMANFVIGGVLTLSGILLSDILYVVVDPRIHFGSANS